MGLRDEWESDDTNVANVGCRISRWVDGFEGDDRVFVLEQLSSRTSTDALLRWWQRKNISTPGKQRLNDHRMRRCTCPDEYGGRIA